jgi:hypothetical protein
MTGFSIATLAITLAGRGLGTLMLKADNRFSRALGGGSGRGGRLPHRRLTPGLVAGLQKSRRGHQPPRLFYAHTFYGFLRN